MPQESEKPDKWSAMFNKGNAPVEPVVTEDEPVPADTDIIISAVQCARCGSCHRQVQFHKFTMPGAFTHWALCPKNDEPMLLKLEEADLLKGETAIG
jgi:hypothetical protein